MDFDRIDFNTREAPAANDWSLMRGALGWNCTGESTQTRWVINNPQRAADPYRYRWNGGEGLH
jgi:hypothetical protein